AELAVKSGRATFVSQNAQIYERHWSAAEEKLRRFFKRKPGIRLDPAGSFVFTIEDGVVKAKLTSVAGDEVLWETEGRNPEALIRDLVHQMPWLEAGHVLYLGQEAEKLSRAIRGQETYRQG
ncbi:MAG: hypothetical protein HY329_17210, partial [Chloroflexi bacterium]|nr:hypothetical protein [Chloroflexota bacterium]